jgi:hypothetical protein
MKTYHYYFIGLIFVIGISSLVQFYLNYQDKTEKINKIATENGISPLEMEKLIDLNGFDFVIDSIAKVNSILMLTDITKSNLIKLMDEKGVIFISDSIQDAIRKENEALDTELKKIQKLEYEKSSAGKINKKHPHWSVSDCQKLADGEIWIGMEYEMLVYLYGKPNSVKVGNYGSGDEYQWCWSDYEPSCFYGKSDGIITAYN